MIISHQNTQLGTKLSYSSCNLVYLGNLPIPTHDVPLYPTHPIPHTSPMRERTYQILTATAKSGDDQGLSHPQTPMPSLLFSLSGAASSAADTALLHDSKGGLYRSAAMPDRAMCISG